MGIKNYCSMDHRRNVYGLWHARYNRDITQEYWINTNRDIERYYSIRNTQSDIDWDTQSIYTV